MSPFVAKPHLGWGDSARGGQTWEQRFNHAVVQLCAEAGITYDPQDNSVEMWSIRYEAEAVANNQFSTKKELYHG